MALAYLLDPSFQFVNENGRPLVGGHIEVYYHHSHLPYITKADFDGTDNPFKVPLNSKGMAVIIADDSNAYDVFCYDAFGTLFWSRENVVVGFGSLQDGSLTEDKFSDLLKLKTIKDYVTPEMFGAAGNGNIDDTTSFQKAIDTGKPVLLLENKTYLLSTITLPNRAIIIGNKAILAKIKVKSGTDSIFSMHDVRYAILKNIYFGSDDESSDVNYIKCTGTVGQCLFENLFFAGGGCGILCESTFWDNSIVNCRFRQNKYGVKLSAGGVSFDHVYFNECSIAGLYLSGSRRVRLTNCLFDSRDEQAEWVNLNQPNFPVEFESCDFEVALMGSNAKLFNIGSSSICSIKNSIIRDIAIAQGASNCALFYMNGNGTIELENITRQGNNYDVFVRAEYGTSKIVKTDYLSLNRLTEEFSVPNSGSAVNVLDFVVTDVVKYDSNNAPSLPSYLKLVNGFVTDEKTCTIWNGSEWTSCDGLPPRYYENYVNKNPVGAVAGSDTAANRKRYFKIGNFKTPSGKTDTSVILITTGSYANDNYSTILLSLNVGRGSSQAFGASVVSSRVLPLHSYGDPKVYLVQNTLDESFDVYVYVGSRGNNIGYVRPVIVKAFKDLIYTESFANVSDADFSLLTSNVVQECVANIRAAGLVPKTESSGTYTLKSVNGTIQWVLDS